MTKITNNDNLPLEFIEQEIKEIEESTMHKVFSIEFIDNGDGTCKEVYDLAPVGFERIRRITGYLVGTVDKWNDAKRAELRDRVKHS